MIPARILGTASLLPGRAVTTAEVVARTATGKDPADAEKRTGIRTRHWTEPGTRMGPIGAEVLRGALDAAGLAPTDLRRIIFVSSTGGDFLIPATANTVAQELGIEGSCDCFDINNACTGFLTAFDLAARCAATGLHPTGIVVVELMSHVIRPDDPRPYLIFGDAAAAVVIGPGRPGEGVRGVSLANRTGYGTTAVLTQPRLSGAIETITFVLSNREMAEGATELIVRSAKEALEQAGESIDDIEWVLPHQPNGRMLEAIVAALGARPSQVLPLVEEMGSVAAASIPVSLDRLIRAGKVRPGDRILMTAVGGGVSYGALLYQVAPDAPDAPDAPGTRNRRQ